MTKDSTGRELPHTKSVAVRVLITLVRRGTSFPEKDLKNLFLTTQVNRETHQLIGQLLDQYMQSFTVFPWDIELLVKVCNLHEKVFYKMDGSYFVANTRTVYPIKYCPIVERKRKRESSLGLRHMSGSKKRRVDFHRKFVWKAF